MTNYAKQMTWSKNNFLSKQVYKKGEYIKRYIYKEKNLRIKCMFYNKMKSNSNIQSILLPISLSKSGTPNPNISLNPNHNSV